MQTTLSVLGGLTITVEFCIEPRDESVGIMSESVGDWQITQIGTRPVKNESAKWLYRRIYEMPGEMERVEVACMERYQQIKEQDAEDYACSQKDYE